MKTLKYILLLLISVVYLNAEEMKVYYPDSPEFQGNKMSFYYFGLLDDDHIWTMTSTSKNENLDEQKLYISILDRNFNFIKSVLLFDSQSGEPLPFFTYRRSDASLIRTDTEYEFFALTEGLFGDKGIHRSQMNTDLKLIKSYYYNRSKRFANPAGLKYINGELYFSSTYIEMMDDYYENYRLWYNFVKIDKEGQVVLEKKYRNNIYPEGDTSELSSVSPPAFSIGKNGKLEQDSDGNFYTIYNFKGFKNNEDEGGLRNWNYRIYGMKFSADGDSLEKKLLESAFTNDSELRDFYEYYPLNAMNFSLDKKNNVLYGIAYFNDSLYYLYKFDNKWNLLWKKTLNFKDLYKGKLYSVDLSGFNMVVANNGDIVIAGSCLTSKVWEGMPTPEQNLAFVCRFNSEGEHIYSVTKQVNTNPKFRMNNPTLIANSKGEYFVGYPFVQPVSGLGNVPVGQAVLKFTDNFSNVDDITVHSDQIKVMPMPIGSNTFDLEFDLINGGDTELRIYNQAGELVISNDYQALSEGTQRLTIDASALPSGSYVCHIKANGQTISKTFIK